ncbi:serine/threonine protein kinase [Pendulispora brunnea]|uniref:Serine/threonine protein kinase n=1 Tax=Pendulispora brunnea TaxID=2905690 RepID=A0ABZ2KHU9_9BACT
MSVHLGRYEVRAKIAEGGMATIYLGKLVGEAGFERPVALKVIKDEFCLNREFVNMFLDEAKIVSRLSHSNIVQLIELGKEGHRLFIAMELLMGQSLWSVWDACRERNIRLRYDVVSWIGARVAEGLHHAHELRDAKGEFVNLVHRDVNASNIFITYDGQVKVVDFGLAKAAGRISRTAAGIVKGKLAYMSPEQTVGRSLDRRTDVFALGATLWELTVDRRLFKGKDDVSTLTAVNEARVPDPTKLVAEYPPELWKVLRTALERDKEKRFPTALEMGKALDECSYLEGRRVTAETIAEVMEALFENERRRMAAWVAASVPGESASHSHPVRASHANHANARPAHDDKPRSSQRHPTANGVSATAEPNAANATSATNAGNVANVANVANMANVTGATPPAAKDVPPASNLKEVPATARANTKAERSLPRTIAPRRITTSAPPPGAFAPPALRKSMASTPDTGHERSERHDRHEDESSSSMMSSQVGPSTVQRAMGGDASCATFSLKFSYFDLDELAAVLVGLGAVALAIATAAAILWDP